LYFNGYNLGEFRKEIAMRKARVFAVILVLVLASLACQGLTRGGGDSSTAPPSKSEPAQESGGEKSDYGFPVTKDAYNVTDFGENSIIYYTKLSMDDVMQFYRDEYEAMGYSERKLLTVVSDTTFSMVFDGDPSDKAVVVQSVDLGDGSRTVSIRLEDA